MPDAERAAHSARSCLRLRRFADIAAFLLPAAIFCFRGLVHLYQRHPHEDAFILFRYAEHLAAGSGIVFNSGGPPAEGATDFLFLVMLAGLVRVGFDVAVGALAINTVGSGLIGLLLSRLHRRHDDGVFVGVVACLLAGTVPFLAGAHASYDGFGTQAYCALAVCTYYALLQRSERARICLTYMGLALGLFRPDGVVLGVGFYLTALLTGASTRLIAHGAVAFALGLFYFAWRYHYFGELLPLPLYVKSHGATLAGLEANLDWFSSSSGPWPLIIVGAAVGVTMFARRGRRSWLPLLGTLPAGLLIGALSFAFQSQNVDWRFQAPAFAVLTTCMVALGAELRTQLRASWSRVIVSVSCLLALAPALREGKKVWPLDYMDSFAVRFGPVLDHSVVALTEAGRMAYWSEAEAYDMIGLNLAQTAKHPPTVEYLASLDPGVVMFHSAGTIDFDRLGLVADRSFEVPVARIDPRALPKAIHDGFRRYLNTALTQYGPEDLSTKVAPVVMSRFLATHPGFAVYAVHYNASYTHVFAIREGRTNTAALESALLAAYRQPYISYAAAKHFPRAL